MFDNSEKSEELFSALQHLKFNKHEVMLFHVMDKSKELEFDYENRPYKLLIWKLLRKLKLSPNEVKKNFH